MLENTIQERMYQLVVNLEEIAVDMGMKLRILDAIREIKKELQHPLSKQEFQKQMLELDELLIQIKKLAVPESKEIAINDVTTVSEEEVRRKIQQILNECSNLNQVIARETLTWDSYIQSTERTMNDLAKAEANYDVITDSQRLMESFERIGKKHNSQMDEVVDVYVEEASANYDRTVKRIGSLLSEIKDSRLKFGPKELYHQWSERYESVKKQLKDQTKQLDKGGRQIESFVEEHRNPIAGIVDAEKKKYKWKKRLPALITGGIILLVLIVVLSKAMQATDMVVDAVATEMEEAGVAGALKDVESSVKSTTNIVNTLKSVVKTESALPAIAAIVVIFVILYLKRAKKMDEQCKASICEKTGNYLEEKLELFSHEKRLEKALEESYAQIVQNVTDTYEGILGEIFGTVLYDEREDEQGGTGKILKLCQEWELIKRGEL